MWKNFGAFKKLPLGLSWWLTGKESVCQCRRHRFDPWPGKIPHASVQLSPYSAATEPTCPGVRAPPQEKPAPHSEEQPHNHSRRKACTAAKTSTAASKPKSKHRGFPGAAVAKKAPARAGDAGHPGSIPGSGRPLEEEMTPYSGILAWKIPGTEEPLGLQSMGP